MEIAELFTSRLSRFTAAALENYRLAVPAMLAVSLAILALVRWSGADDLWLLPVSVPLYLLAVVVTFRRLEAIGKSGWWILLMVTSFRVGPEVLGFTVGSVMNLVPVLLAWREPKSGAMPAEA
jgi:uncharacterized membrane protein YhaH (DUF805 family)